MKELVATNIVPPTGEELNQVLKQGESTLCKLIVSILLSAKQQTESLRFNKSQLTIMAVGIEVGMRVMQARVEKELQKASQRVDEMIAIARDSSDAEEKGKQ